MASQNNRCLDYGSVMKKVLSFVIFFFMLNLVTLGIGYTGYDMYKMIAIYLRGFLLRLTEYREERRHACAPATFTSPVVF